MKYLFSLLSFFTITAIGDFTETKTPIRKPTVAIHGNPSGDTTKYEMNQYWIAFLYRGTQRGQDSAAAAKIQAAHMANITKLANAGVIIMAGPMGDKGDLRGIFIMNAPDSATAASYIQSDSAIVTGRLRFEVKPWWTAKGKYEFK